ncbi:MAG: M48 family metalloprotease [Patescibacteria group bacterium]
MYSDIASNKRKTFFLMIVFIVVVFGIGWAYGEWSGDRVGGLVLAAVLSITMNLVGYFKSDKIALATAKAKVIEKQEHPELWNIVENLAITAGIPMPKVAIIHDPSPNAFATGRNPEHAVIAVTTGLLETLNRAELEGVVSHEMSHIKNYDILLMTVAVVLIGSITLLARFAHFGGNKRGEGGPLVIIGLIFLILSPIIGELMKMAISRKREYLADASGALLTRYPEGLASALEKISADGSSLHTASPAIAHLFISNPFGARTANFFSTHPPIEDRVKRLRGMI